MAAISSRPQYTGAHKRFLANDRRRYIVARSLIGWAHTQNDQVVYCSRYDVTILSQDLSTGLRSLWKLILPSANIQNSSRKWLKFNSVKRGRRGDGYIRTCVPLQWRHNECDGVSNHRHLACSPKRVYRHRSKKTSKLPVTDLCRRKSPMTGGFPWQRASNTENASVWWRHHAKEDTAVSVGCNYLSLPLIQAPGTSPHISYNVLIYTQITRFIGPTWGPTGSCRLQMGPMLAP